MVAEDGDVGHFLGCHPAPQGWQQGDADGVKHTARGRGAQQGQEASQPFPRLGRALMPLWSPDLQDHNSWDLHDWPTHRCEQKGMHGVPEAGSRPRCDPD